MLGTREAQGGEHPGPARCPAALPPARPRPRPEAPRRPGPAAACPPDALSKRGPCRFPAKLHAAAAAAAAAARGGAEPRPPAPRAPRAPRAPAGTPRPGRPSPSGPDSAQPPHLRAQVTMTAPLPASRERPDSPRCPPAKPRPPGPRGPAPPNDPGRVCRREGDRRDTRHASEKGGTTLHLSPPRAVHNPRRGAGGLPASPHPFPFLLTNLRALAFSPSLPIHPSAQRSIF